MSTSLAAGTYYLTLTSAAPGASGVQWGYSQTEPVAAWSWVYYSGRLVPDLTLTPNNLLNSFSINGDVPTEPPTVPEPSSMLLLASGLVGLAGYGRRRLRK